MDFIVKKAKVALYGDDSYMSCLIDYLCKKSCGMIETRLFTDMGLLREQTGTGNVDLLLAGEEEEKEVETLAGSVRQILLLSEEDTQVQTGGCRRIFRYQSAEAVVQEILSCIAEDDAILLTGGMSPKAKRQMDYIGVYAPFGGAGVTEYALSKAREQQDGVKSLYISLELFSGFPVPKEGKKGKEEEFRGGMSEVIFYLKERTQKLALKLESLIVPVDGQDCILAVEDYRDLYSLNNRDIRCLLEILSRQTQYGRVVFDIGVLFDAALFLMEGCTSLWMPSADTARQKQKKKAFLDFLARAGHEKLAQRFASGNF